MTCASCSFSYYECVVKFYEDNEASLEFFRSHGVLPRTVVCPRCKSPCAYRRDRRAWRCRKSLHSASGPKKRCSYMVSDSKGSFLTNANIPPWKILLFVNHFLSQLWDHRTVFECIELSTSTSVDWRSFCCEVTDAWFQNQDPIGGAGVDVEIDVTLIAPSRYNGSTYLEPLWLFGGIERSTKRRFVLTLKTNGEPPSKSTLAPLIRRYIKPGSIIYSEADSVYKDSLSELGLPYKHVLIDDPESVGSGDDDDHVPRGRENNSLIHLFWRELKMWVKRPGIKSKYMHQYLSRYLFISSVADKTSILHKFFAQAAKLYPPFSQRQPRVTCHPEDSNSETQSDDEDDDPQLDPDIS